VPLGRMAYESCDEGRNNDAAAQTRKRLCSFITRVIAPFSVRNACCGPGVLEDLRLVQAAAGFCRYLRDRNSAHMAGNS